MTVINGAPLLYLAPIKDMVGTKVKEYGVSHGLGEAGYDIRINQSIYFEPDNRSNVDHYIIVTHENGVPEHTMGRFTLASAMEEFDMPHNLVGVVHDKSTWARQGLSVFNTVIEPGWKGFLTLELVFHGNKPVHIPRGSGIAQVIFSSLARDAGYEGKYQNQANEPVPALLE